MPKLFPAVLWRFGPIELTDTLVESLALSAILVVAALVAIRARRARELLLIAYAGLERTIGSMVNVDARPLVPLIVTQWLFLSVANLAGLVPGISSPTRDLSVTAALALVSFGAGHYFAFRVHGFAYLRQYLQPNPFLLPFNIIGEVSRTIAMALRLFGNIVSGTLIGSIVLYLAGLLLPVPLMVLSVLTALVQAYIFGVLTLVFTAASMEAAHGRASSLTPDKEPTP